MPSAENPPFTRVAEHPDHAFSYGQARTDRVGTNAVACILARECAGERENGAFGGGVDMPLIYALQRSAGVCASRFRWRPGSSVTEDGGRFTRACAGGLKDGKVLIDELNV